MKAKKPIILCTCKTCLQSYDKNEVKRTLGKESLPYLLGYCSAFCYTNKTTK